MNVQIIGDDIFADGQKVATLARDCKNATLLETFIDGVQNGVSVICIERLETEIDVANSRIKQLEASLREYELEAA
jgi:hypothetical protein